MSESAPTPALTNSGPASQDSAAHPLIEQLWNLFASPRAAVVQAALVLIAIVFGALIFPPGTLSGNIDGPTGAEGIGLRAMRIFELYDPLNSWWFTVLLTSLGMSVFATSIERLPRLARLLRNPTKRLESALGAALRASVPSAGATKEALDRAESLLREQGFAVERLAPETDASERLFAESARHTLVGPFLCALGLLVALGGAIAGRFPAFSGFTSVAQGGETDSFRLVQPNGTSFKQRLTDLATDQGIIIRCDALHVREVAPGKLEPLDASLRIFDRTADGAAGRLLTQGAISPDHALSFAGLTFHAAGVREVDGQMRARITVINKASGEKHEVVVGPGEPIEAAPGLHYELVDYSPNFAGQGAAMQVVRTEQKPGTPRTQAGRGSADAKVTSFWIFAKSPNFDSQNREDRFGFSFDKLESVYAIELRLASDPGLPIVAVGLALLCIGLILALSGVHKRIWIKLGAGEMTLAGTSTRRADAFAREFAGLSSALNLPLSSSRPAP